MTYNSKNFFFFFFFALSADLSGEEDGSTPEPTAVEPFTTSEDVHCFLSAYRKIWLLQRGCSLHGGGEIFFDIKSQAFLEMFPDCFFFFFFLV